MKLYLIMPKEILDFLYILPYNKLNYYLLT